MPTRANEITSLDEGAVARVSWKYLSSRKYEGIRATGSCRHQHRRRDRSSEMSERLRSRHGAAGHGLVLVARPSGSKNVKRGWVYSRRQRSDDLCTCECGDAPTAVRRQSQAKALYEGRAAGDWRYFDQLARIVNAGARLPYPCRQRQQDLQ